MQSKFSTFTIFFYFYILNLSNIKLLKIGRMRVTAYAGTLRYEKEGGTVFGLYK